MFRRFLIKSTLRLIKNVKIGKSTIAVPAGGAETHNTKCGTCLQDVYPLNIKLIIFLQAGIRRRVKRTSWTAGSN